MLTKIENFLTKMSFQLVFKTDYSLGILNVLQKKKLYTRSFQF